MDFGDQKPPADVVNRAGSIDCPSSGARSPNGKSRLTTISHGVETSPKTYLKNYP